MESSIVEDIKFGDVKAFENVFQEYYKALCGHAYKLLLDGDDATNIINYNDDEGNPVAMVEVRCILPVETPTDCSDAGDNLPLQPHRGPPPTGSGYSLKYFEVRRYGITSTSTNGNTQVQVGVYKVFNKQ